jgi:DNA-binding Lrp family transcriptional regulator
LLQEDSRLSFNKIACKLGVSVGTAYNRIKNLESLGIIKGYTTVVDSGKLGFDLTAIILIQAAGKFLSDVETELANENCVIAIYDVTGDYDAAIITKFKDRLALNNFVKSLLANPHIKRTVTNLVLNVIKEDCLTRIAAIQKKEQTLNAEGVTEMMKYNEPHKSYSSI